MIIALLTLNEKYPYSEFFSFVFSRIRTEYGEILRISRYSVQIQESTDLKNSEYGHFSRSVTFQIRFVSVRAWKNQGFFVVFREHRKKLGA